MLWKSFKFISRFIIYGSLAVLLLATVVVWRLRSLYPPERIRQELSDNLTEQLGFPVTLGSVEWSIFPTPWINVKDISIQNQSQSATLTAQEARLILLPSSLNLEKIQVTSAIIEKPEIRMRIDPDISSDFVKLRTRIQEMGSKTSSKKFKGKIQFNDVLIQEARVILSTGSKLQGAQFAHFLFDGKGNYSSEKHHFVFQAFGHGLPEFPLGEWKINGEIGKKTEVNGEIKKLPIQTLSRYWPKMKDLDGKVDSQIWLFRDQNNKKKWSFTGEVSSMTINHIPNSPYVQAEWSQTSQKGTSLVVNAVSSSSSVDLSLSISDLKKNEINFDLNSEKFDLSEVRSWVTHFKKSGGSQKYSQWVATGQVRAENGKIDNFKFDKARADLHISSTQWTFSNLVGVGLGGGASGNLIIKPSPVKGRSEIIYSGRVDGIRAEKLVGIWKQNPAILGYLNLEGNLQGPISKDYLRDAVGKVKLDSQDGELGKIPTILKVISSLNLKTLLGISEDDREHLTYKTLDGILHFSKGIIHSNDLKLESEKLLVKARGDLNLKNNTIDAKVSVRTETIVDEVINIFPGVKKILKKRKSIVPFWAHVKGSIEKPSVRKLK